MERWLVVLSLLLVWPVRAQLVPLWPLPVPDTSADNAFGVAVALGVDRAVVGASGVHGCGPASGAVYVYERQGEVWRLAAVLQPDDCAPGRHFGRAVALDGDRILAVAAGQPYRTEVADAAYVFERKVGGHWQQTARLTAPSGVNTGAFGAAVALEGTRAVVSTWGDPAHQRPGAAYVFAQQPDGRWVLEATLTDTLAPRGPWPGGAVVLSGNVIALAAPSYRYDRPSAVLLFVRRSDGTWEHDTTFTGVRDFNPALALARGELLVGERLGGVRSGGRVRHYRRQADGRWRLVGTLDPPQPYPNGGFGAALAFDGRWALISGFDEQLGLDFNVDQVVYVFMRTADRWCFWRRIDPGEKAFGAALSLHGDRALVSVPREGAPGAAYLIPLDAARCRREP